VLNQIKLVLIVVFIMAGSGCAYFNTFFNAKQSYKSANKKLEKIKSGQISADIKKDFETAIDKSWKLINAYSDSNKYADDALLLIGKSHYHIQEYEKTERYLTQFVARYGDSELLPEAKLWLARSLVHLKREEEALKRFDEILASESDRDIAAYALYGLGELYLKQKDYSNAIVNLKRCVEVSNDDKISAEAQFFIGNIYFDQKEYTFAIENYSKVLKYETPLNIDFESQFNKATAQIYIGEFDEATTSLQKMLRADRYKEKFGLIQAKLGECYEEQDDSEAAARQYIYVIEEFSRTEGASFASYHLAQLMEYYYADMDSSRRLYLRSTKEFNQFEFKQEATERAEILEAYLDITDDIAYDILDFEKVSRLDSAQINELIAMDSLRGEVDTTTVPDFFSDTENDFAFNNAINDSNSAIPQNSPEEENKVSDLDQTSLESEQNNLQSELGDVNDGFTTTEEEGDSTVAQSDSLNKPLDISFDRIKKNKQHKTRHKADIVTSFKKNRFKLAEFFLLTMQNYDSAEVAYENFITLYEDPILTPRAYYALNYIYSFILVDSIKQDSIAQIIVELYPGSEFAEYILRKKFPESFENKDEVQLDFNAERYTMGEKELFEGNYSQALDIFNTIAIEDSGGAWGEKGLYAVAWIYENKLNDISKAIEAYTILSQEYPNSEFGAVAHNKIKEPPPDIVPVDSTSQADSVHVDSLSTLENVGDLQENAAIIDTLQTDLPESGEGEETE
jgi:TolA-binding protein